MDDDRSSEKVSRRWCPPTRDDLRPESKERYEEQHQVSLTQQEGESNEQEGSSLPISITSPTIDPVNMNRDIAPGAVAVEPPWRVEEDSESLTVEGDSSLGDNHFVTANVVTQAELEREFTLMVKKRGVIADVVENQSRGRSVQKTVLYVLVTIAIIVALAVGFSFGLNAKVGNSSSNELSDLPTVNVPYTSFASLDDLYRAVDEYMIAGNASLAAERYGYPMGTWDVSYLSNFSRLFDPERAPEKMITGESALRPSASTFNEDIAGWDMSNAESLYGMFWGANSFDQDLSRWNVSKVRDFSFMFHSAYSFRGRGLDAWHTLNARTLRRMLMGAQSLQIEDLNGWTVSRVIDFAHLFGESGFVGNVSAWDVSSGAKFEYMFRATAFNGDLSSWNMERGVDLSGMFGLATEFEGVGLEHWNPRFANSLNYMFFGCSSFKKDLCHWSIPPRAMVHEMFNRTQCPDPSPPNLTDVPVSPLCFPCSKM